MRSSFTVRGTVEYWLMAAHTPFRMYLDEAGVLQVDGQVDRYGTSTNVVTAVGDRMYVERGANISGQPLPPAGMRLGTSTTQPQKTGAGAAIGTYVGGSAGTLDAGYPASSTFGDAWRVTYLRTWPAGTATTASYITECALTNESAVSDYAGVAADTVARVLLHPPTAKPAGQALVIAWHHDSLGT